MFAHLSVFVDGVDLATAERVAADLGLPGDPGSALARLVDASMIEATFEGGRTRYRMLETLRMFGLDRLAAAGEADAAAGRMLRWAVDLTTWVGATMTTQREPEADAILRRELPNLRAAWRRARQQAALNEAVSMVAALFDAVGYRDLVEMRGWVEELVSDPALRRPGSRVWCAQLAPGRSHAHNSRTGVAGQGHETTRQVGLVVRMGPHPEDGAQSRDSCCRPDHGRLRQVRSVCRTSPAPQQVMANTHS